MKRKLDWASTIFSLSARAACFCFSRSRSVPRCVGVLDAAAAASNGLAFRGPRGVVAGEGDAADGVGGALKALPSRSLRVSSDFVSDVRMAEGRRRGGTAASTTGVSTTGVALAVLVSGWEDVGACAVVDSAEAAVVGGAVAGSGAGCVAGAVTMVGRATFGVG